MHTLADRLDLIVEGIEPAPFSTHDSIIYWMGRFAPKLTADRYFRAYWIWYGALASLELAFWPRVQCAVPCPGIGGAFRVTTRGV